MEEVTREARFNKLKEMLLAREYSPGIIDAAIARARAIPRHLALRRVSRPETTHRPAFVVYYDSRMPSISKITGDQWYLKTNTWNQYSHTPP